MLDNQSRSLNVQGIFTFVREEAAPMLLLSGCLLLKTHLSCNTHYRFLQQTSLQLFTMEKSISLPPDATVHIEGIASSVDDTGTVSDREAMQRLGKRQIFKVRHPSREIRFILTTRSETLDSRAFSASL